MYAPPPNALRRRRVTSPISIGVRAIDGLLTCGEGQRIGLFAAAGVGKSTLVRQLGDLYHNGSYGEGEKGVWDPRVLEDIALGENAVGVTAYFAALFASIASVITDTNVRRL